MCINKPYECNGKEQRCLCTLNSRNALKDLQVYVKTALEKLKNCIIAIQEGVRLTLNCTCFFLHKIVFDEKQKWKRKNLRNVLDWTNGCPEK